MKFTIFKRLIFSYISILLLVVFLTGYITIKLNQLNNLTRAIATVDSRIIVLIERLLDSIISQVSFEKKFFISKDPDFSKKFWEIQEYVIEDMKSVEDVADSEVKRQLALESSQLYQEYLSLFKLETDAMAMGEEYFQKEFQDKREQVYQNLAHPGGVGVDGVQEKVSTFRSWSTSSFRYCRPATR